MFRFGSVCSGIESASVAWEPLGCSAAWFSEIEPFPCAVLKHHWPKTVNYGDMYNLKTLILAGVAEAPPVLVGGTPCQAFSVSGKRESLDDERGQLTLEYVGVLNAIDSVRGAGEEAVCVWENVPGVLNTKDNAFGCFLGELVGAGCELTPGRSSKWTSAGYVAGPQRNVAWRVLDAQYFGVAQRRRRVFVVASARNGFDPREVLFERQGVQRHIEPCRETRQEAARGSRISADPRAVGALTAFGVGVTGAEDNQAQAGHLLVSAFKIGQGAGAGGIGYGQQIAPTLTSSTSGTQQSLGLLTRSAVRKLTPVECERLQGFPDNHTRIPYRNKTAENCPDGPRYKAIGNSKAVPVVQWVGKRLIEELNK